MDYQGQHDQDKDLYGGEVPEEAYLEADFKSPANAEASAFADADIAAEDSKAKELENMKKRLHEIEEEAGALRTLRKMQEKVEKEMGGTQERFFRLI